MAIYYNGQDRTFTLQTASTTYQMRIGELGVLEHLYYGRKVEDCCMAYLHRRADIGFSPNPNDAGEDRTYSLDLQSQEYPSYGVGDFRVYSVGVIHPDGSRAADFRYVSHEIRKTTYSIPGLPAVYGAEGEGETLVVTMKDTASELVLELYYGILEAEDMITRSARLLNEGSQTVQVTKFHSACLDVPYGNWELVHFHGRHAMERQMERVGLMHGIMTVGSRRGTSSHHHNPAVILCGQNATEETGDCYGINLMYSGNFTIETECDQMNQVRLTAGISPEDFCWNLEAGESLAAPQVLFTYSDQGFGALTRRFHHTIRHHVCRGEYKLKARPVLINNWEATYFDFDDEKILKIAAQAADLGIDMMVLDDGWFGKRDDDNSGLGDWYVNTKKLREGLPELVKKINALGMKFGLWLEPEMISEDSDLYRSHPDWALQIPGRKPARGRNQLVLDMGREDVRTYLYDCISGILDSAPIEYIKWDFNRSIADFYSHSLPAGKQGEGHHRFVLGIYDLMERLVSRYPHVLFEGCSGGGGRFDTAMLYYTPQIWCSDDTDAVERLEIQYGTSFFYPVSSVGSHVSTCPNHQTGRTTSFHTRGVVAMAGSFGYELDLNLLSEEEKQQVKQQVAVFKQFDTLIHAGSYYRLAGPYDNDGMTAWEYAAEDGSEALVNVVVSHVRANWLGMCLKLKGLLPEAKYEIQWMKAPADKKLPFEAGKDLEGTMVLSGDALMYGGISIPMLYGDYPALQIYLKQLL